MKRTLILTTVALTGAGLFVFLPQWRLNADETQPFRQQGDRPEAFRDRGRPGMAAGGRSEMREQLLQRFDEILDRLTRIERRLGGRPLEGLGNGGRGRADRGERGRGPRPPRPDWMGAAGEGFRPGPWMQPPREGESQLGSEGRPLDRLELPEELRERMEQRMEQGRERMEQVRSRMAEAREKFIEMQERIETLEAEVQRLKEAAKDG
jgi:hypothetical protein